MKKISILLLFFVCTSLNAQESGFCFGADVYGGKGIDQRSKTSFGANIVAGWRFSEFAFLGIGAGFQRTDAQIEHVTVIDYDVTESYDYSQVNRFKLFVRSKMNLSDKPISPFVLFDAGTSFGSKTTLDTISGLFLEPAVGCDFKLGGVSRLYLMLGYQCQNTELYHHGGSREDPYEFGLKQPESFSRQLTLHIGCMF